MELILVLCLYLVSRTASQHQYWDWVVACSDRVVQSQDRYVCTLDGKELCRESRLCNAGVLRPAQEYSACLPGWTGALCSVPVCKEGCDQMTGYCSQPGECLCRLGWADCVP